MTSNRATTPPTRTSGVGARGTKRLSQIVRQNGTVFADGVRDVDELVELMAPFTRPHTILPQGRSARLNAHVSALGSENVAFTWLSYGADVAVIPDDVDPDVFLFPLSTAGQGNLVYGSDSIPISSTDSTIIAPYRASRSEAAHDYDQVIVAIRRGRVEALAGGLLGADGPIPLTVPLTTIDLDPAARSLLEAAASMATDHSVGPDFRRRFDDLVIESVLLSLPGLENMSRPAPAVHSRQVRAALDYMSDHLAEPLTLTAVAGAVGVSVRSLQAKFRADLDQTPMAWLRDKRLDNAYGLIHSTEQPLSAQPVADAARASGFHHLGDFSAAFKTRFGETPSNVVRRVRGRPFRP